MAACWFILPGRSQSRARSSDSISNLMSRRRIFGVALPLLRLRLGKAISPRANEKLPKPFSAIQSSPPFPSMWFVSDSPFSLLRSTLDLPSLQIRSHPSFWMEKYQTISQLCGLFFREVFFVAPACPPRCSAIRPPPSPATPRELSCPPLFYFFPRTPRIYWPV